MSQRKKASSYGLRVPERSECQISLWGGSMKVIFITFFPWLKVFMQQQAKKSRKCYYKNFWPVALFPFGKHWARKQKTVLVFHMPKQYCCVCSHYCGKADDHKVNTLSSLEKRKTGKCMNTRGEKSWLGGPAHLHPVVVIKGVFFPHPLTLAPWLCKYYFSSCTFKELKLYFTAIFCSKWTVGFSRPWS